MACFLEHIPYMYVHLPTHHVGMQKLPVVSVRMQHILLTVVNSDEQQMVILLRSPLLAHVSTQRV